MPGENLDLTSRGGELKPTPHESADAPFPRRRFVGIHFQCCRVYSRVYVNPEGTAYAGHCPLLRRKLILKIGPGGTDARFFTAG